MRYYKIIESGYIAGIGTGGGGTEITQEEYNTIMGVIQEKPTGTATTDYRLKEDLTWEEYELPPEPVNPEIDDTEALNIIMGREINGPDNGNDLPADD